MEPRTRAILLRTLIFTILVPGSVTVLIPCWILRSRPSADYEISAFRLGGILPIVLGAAVYFSCAWEFVKTGVGTPAPIDAPKALVARGLYRYTRNPMYVGVASILVGEAVFFQSLRLLAYALIVGLLFHAFILLYEEPTLRRKFGPSYEEYLKAVPRWIPNLRPARPRNRV
jgi:protein-S-isoprenylcysteine O-methyltransferase Ste14